MRMIYKLLPIAGAALLLAGCNYEPLPPPEAPPAERVFLMYDNINDHPSRPFAENVRAAGAAVAAGALDPGERVIVFHRSYRATDQSWARSVIYELVRDSSQDEGFRREMLREYASGENATLSTDVMAAVMRDIRTAVPAPHYGLAFGSHGKGWIPRSNTTSIMRKGASPGAASERPFAELWVERENPLTRYFQGYGQKLDVAEFIDALDEWEWDFIILDDCFMASVEALYDMRTLADYIIASPTEIMINGFPYDRVVSILFREWENNLERSVVDVGDAFVESYRTGEMHSIRSATVAVVKSAELDALAETVRRLNLNLNELTSTTGIQYYEGFARPGHLFFDLDDYLRSIRASAVPTEYNAFRSQLERAVVFKGHTESFYSDFPFPAGTFTTVTHFSGLNVFIPWGTTASFISDYQRTGWYKAVYANSAAGK